MRTQKFGYIKRNSSVLGLRSSDSLFLVVASERKEHRLTTMMEDNKRGLGVTCDNLPLSRAFMNILQSPSPFGFANLSQPPMTAPNWQPPAFQHLTNTLSSGGQQRSQKRRLDDDADRDEAMDRSPTPERPKRAPPKRARVLTADENGAHRPTKDKSTNSEEQDIDAGLLLGP